MSVPKYYEDIQQYGIQTREAEKETAQRKEKAFTNLRNSILKNTESWSIIFRKWNNIKKNEKSPNKMVEEYGNTKYSSEDLAQQIESNLTCAYEIYKKGKKRKISNYIQAAGLSKDVYIEIAKKLSSKDANIEKFLNEFYKYRDELVTANFLLVINFAKDFNIYGVSFDDLVQEGNLGLIRAAEKFDPKREKRFGTYAGWWIRQSFIYLVKNHSKTIRLPSHIHNFLTKIKKIQEDYESRLKREPTFKELSKLTGFPEDRIEILLEMRIDPISLETNVHSTPKGSKQKQIKDIVADSVDFEHEVIHSIIRQDILDKVYTLLDENEKIILSWKFGLDGPELSIGKIADKLGITKLAVKSILESVLQKIVIEAPELKDYY